LRAPGRVCGRIVVVVMLLWATACQVRVSAGIDVDQGGGGTVRAAVGLDAEALANVGDLGAVLRVDDLRQAGWRVDGPRKEGDGLTWVRASRPFSRVEDADRALSELSGAGGPFRDLAFRRSRSFLHTRTSVSGVVDLTRGAAGFGDDDLQAKVGDTLRLDPDGLRAELGPDADRALSVQFEARLPGSMRSNASVRAGGSATWRPALGQQVRIEASSQVLNLVPLVLAALALLVVVGVATTVVLLRR
jgi:hypothetical protein